MSESQPKQHSQTIAVALVLLAPAAIFGLTESTSFLIEPTPTWVQRLLWTVGCITVPTIGTQVLLLAALRYAEEWVPIGLALGAVAMPWSYLMLKHGPLTFFDYALANFNWFIILAGPASVFLIAEALRRRYANAT